MLVKRVAERVFPRLRKLAGMDAKPLTSTLTTAAENVENKFVMLSDNPTLAEKRRAVSNYLKGQFIPNVTKKMNTPTLEKLTVRKTSELVQECGNDLGEIKRLYGNYGLSEYAKVNEDKVLRKKYVKQHGRKVSHENTFSDDFNNYLLDNEVLKIKDIKENYGECGLQIQHHYAALGFFRTGVASDGAVTCRLSERGREAVKMITSIDKMKPAMDGIIKALK